MRNILLTTLAALLIFSGCTRTVDSPGKLVIKVTDDPFNISFVESATITVTKVEIRKRGEHEGYPFTVLSEDTITFDLLQLRNGVTKELVDLEIPAGSYDLIRLYIDDASLKLKDRAEAFTVKVPSGKQTGIKIFLSPVLQVTGGLTSELLLDFDLARSFVMRGNLANSAGINGFIFKPVIRASNNSTAGRIAGFVTDTSLVSLGNAKVWVKQDSVVSTAYTDTLGHYAFIGMPAGTYSVYATSENYDTAGYEGVKVIEGNKTVLNFKLTKE
jgi:hypothetical protein